MLPIPFWHWSWGTRIDPHKEISRWETGIDTLLLVKGIALCRVVLSPTISCLLFRLCALLFCCRIHVCYLCYQGSETHIHTTHTHTLTTHCIPPSNWLCIQSVFSISSQQLEKLEKPVHPRPTFSHILLNTDSHLSLGNKQKLIWFNPQCKSWFRRQTL